MVQSEPDELTSPDTNVGFDMRRGEGEETDPTREKGNPVTRRNTYEQEIQ